MSIVAKHNSLTCKDAEEALTLPKSWWAYIAILPLTKRVSLFLANRTRILPNAISLTAFFICVLAGCLFAFGHYGFLIAGAILFEINYLLDCVDGTVARLTKKASSSGAFIDFMLDQWRIVFCLGGLLIGHYSIHSNHSVIIAGFAYLFIKMAFVFHGHVRHSITSRHGKFIIESSIDPRNGFLMRHWLKFAVARKLSPKIGSVETDTIVFFFGPVLNQVLPFMIIGAALLTLAYAFAIAGTISCLKDDPIEQALLDTFHDEKIRDIAVFGTGAAAGNFMGWCNDQGISGKINCFLDNDAVRHNTTSHNRPVCSPDIIRQHKPDLVVITSKAGRFDITRQLAGMGMHQDKDFIYANFSK